MACDDQTILLATPARANREAVFPGGRETQRAGSSTVASFWLRHGGVRLRSRIVVPRRKLDLEMLVLRIPAHEADFDSAAP